MKTLFFDLALDPETSYLIFMTSLALIYAELTHPGLTGPGVIGSIGLVLSLISFAKLDLAGYNFNWGFLITITVVFAAVVAGLSYLALQAHRRRRKDHDHDLKTQQARVTRVEAGGRTGQVEILGEFWNFESDSAVQLNDSIEVLHRNGLTLKIRKKA